MRDLRDFISLLRERGDLAVIDEPVDPVLEITEIADRVVKSGGPALLFRNPHGSSFPVFINQFGSEERTLTALRAESLQALSGRGMDRLQVFDRRTTGMHWHRHKDGAQHYRSAGGKLEVAVAIGTDPAVTYAATAPLPGTIDEMAFAGFLRGKPVEMSRCLTVDLQVPADSEIVLEGYVEAGELRTEGPFGDHTGYYSPADEYPVFHVTALTHRENPIYSTTIVGKPPMEDCFLAKATERIFLPLLQMTLPEVVDMDLPQEGVFHNCAILSVRKAYPMHARKVMHAVWGTGQMQFTKFVVVVDAEVDVHDYSEVTWRVFSNVDPKRDILMSEGPLDELDHSSPTTAWGAKMGVDATARWSAEGHRRGWPEDIVMSPEVKARIDKIWSALGLN